jgi:hypothetical protein
MFSYFEEIIMQLTSENVSQVFLHCLFKEGEDTSNHVAVKGITLSVGFHPERLKEKSSQIDDLLDQLPVEFHEKGGGGMSFLQSGIDKNGRHWGEHKNMQELFLLGVGTGRIAKPFPDELVDSLPGGVPYFIVKSK